MVHTDLKTSTQAAAPVPAPARTAPAPTPPPPATEQPERPKAPPKAPSFGPVSTIGGGAPARPSGSDHAHHGALKNKNFRIVLPPLHFGDASGPVERSWELVRGEIDSLGVQVVVRWFGRNPDHLQLFPFRDAPDLARDPRSVAHGRSVLSAVGAVVAGMRDVEGLSGTVDHLAAVHAHRGVRRDMFPALGGAIMSVLSERLAGQWTEEVRAAWESVFEKLAARINDAMDQVAAAEAESLKHPQQAIPEKDENAEEPVPDSKFGRLKSIERGVSFSKGAVAP